MMSDIWKSLSRLKLKILPCILWACVPVYATSIVVLRSADGTVVVVAADSQFTPEKGSPLTGCKIAQIEKQYWIAIAEISADPERRFSPYQIAIDAAAHNKNNLVAIVTEFQRKSTALLPAVIRHRRKFLGKHVFDQRYEGKPAMQAVFLGKENGVLRVVAIDFIVRTRKGRGVEIAPKRNKCPGNCAVKAPLKVFLVSHEVIDAFSPSKQDTADLDSLARKLVQEEIDNDRACNCAMPIDVLHIDSLGTHWVGPLGPLCHEVQQ